MEHPVSVQNPASRPTCYWADVEENAKGIAPEPYSIDDMTSMVVAIETMIETSPKSDAAKKRMRRLTVIRPDHVRAWMKMGRPVIIGFSWQDRGEEITSIQRDRQNDEEILF